MVPEGIVVFKLLACDGQSLLDWRNAFSVLDFGLNITNSVSIFYFECDGFACVRLDQDLPTLIIGMLERPCGSLRSQSVPPW